MLETRPDMRVDIHCDDETTYSTRWNSEGCTALWVGPQGPATLFFTRRALRNLVEVLMHELLHPSTGEVDNGDN